MSDYHPESWNPVWSHDKILIGLLSFMSESASTAGSITTSDETKRLFARDSLAFNCKNEVFRRLFPDLVELHDEREAAARGGGGAGEAVSGGGAAAGGDAGGAPGGARWSAVYWIVGGLVAAWLLMHLVKGQGGGVLEF